MRAGDRVGVAVSGGADSVALLRLLLELRAELGLVLSVVHFNHKIRGEAADADEQFVRELAARFELPFLSRSGDAPALARVRSLSLETAARELRYGYFRELLGQGGLDKIATAHTLDDQAETVLMRLVRGAWTTGLAGIYPQLAAAEQPTKHTAGQIVRPLLSIPRSALEAYLGELGQPWRQDATNQDIHHLRNRVRHLLLPLLQREFNPAIKRVLAETAEIARAEEEFWSQSIRSSGNLEARLRPDLLRQVPLALRRRMVRYAAEEHGLRLAFQQVESVLKLVSAETATACELPNGWVAERQREHIVFHRVEPGASAEFEYVLSVPGVIHVAELRLGLRASVITLKGSVKPGYNLGDLLDPLALGSRVRVRNWRPGDRFRPAHTKSAKKVKELLQARHISGPERALWPVAVNAAGELVWMRGFGPAEPFACAPGVEEAVLIQEFAATASDRKEYKTAP